MSLDFFRKHGAHRVESFDPSPKLLGEGITLSPPSDAVARDYELTQNAWKPLAGARLDRRWNLRPQRFVSAKDAGRTVTYITSREGFRVPVRLAQVGGLALETQICDGQTLLKREAASAARVVCFMADLFAWPEIERLAAELHRYDFEFWPLSGAKIETQSGAGAFDFELMRQANFNRTREAKWAHQRAALCADTSRPTVLDGSLKPFMATLGDDFPVVGIVKTHPQNYLHSLGWRTFYDLKAGQRTPAFIIEHQPGVVSFYVRLCTYGGDSPARGVVRAEVTRAFFEGQMRGEFGYLDQLAAALCDFAARDAANTQAPNTLAPLARAETLLGALFTPSEPLMSRFYRLARL